MRRVRTPLPHHRHRRTYVEQSKNTLHTLTITRRQHTNNTDLIVEYLAQRGKAGQLCVMHAHTHTHTSARTHARERGRGGDEGRITVGAACRAFVKNAELFRVYVEPRKVPAITALASVTACQVAENKTIFESVNASSRTQASPCHAQSSLSGDAIVHGYTINAYKTPSAASHPPPPPPPVCSFLSHLW